MWVATHHPHPMHHAAIARTGLNDELTIGEIRKMVNVETPDGNHLYVASITLLAPQLTARAFRG